MNAALAIVFSALGDDGNHAESRAPSRRVQGKTIAAEQHGIPSDISIVSGVQRGDRAVFETIYRTHASALAAFANGFIHAPDISEEIVNDIFVRLWEIRHTFQPVAGVRAYLFAAARNRALDHLRSERRADTRYRIVAEATEPSMIESASGEHSEMIAAVQRVIDTFPPLRRQILDLRLGQGLSNPEIAEVMGLTDQAVRSHVSRAMRDLRAIIPTLASE